MKTVTTILKNTALATLLYRCGYTFLTLAPGRIMRKTSRENAGGQHGADRSLLVGGVYGALTNKPNRVCRHAGVRTPSETASLLGRRH